MPRLESAVHTMRTRPKVEMHLERKLQEILIFSIQGCKDRAECHYSYYFNGKCALSYTVLYLKYQSLRYTGLYRMGLNVITLMKSLPLSYTVLYLKYQTLRYTGLYGIGLNVIT